MEGDMKKLVFTFLLLFITFAFSQPFQPGQILIRDDKNFYIFNNMGVEIKKFSGSAPMVWIKDIGLITSKIEDGFVIFKVFKTPEDFYKIKTEIKAKSVKKLLKKDEEFILLYIEPEKDAIKVAIFSKDFKCISDIYLRDPSGNYEILKEGKAFIYDAVIFKDKLWISGYPYHSGEISFYPIVFSKKVPEEIKDLFSEEEIIAEVEKNKGKRIGKISGIAGNNRGIGLYDDKNLISVDTNLPGKLTIFSPETNESKILTISIDPSLNEKWGFYGILVLENEILVSNVHPNVKKIYRIDKKTGQVKGIFASGITGIEMQEIQ